jgi:post-segregation antitoxin (ccd killing protein)
MCMARVNVYLPDDLAARAKEADLNVSSLTQKALEQALAAQASNAWLARVRLLPPSGVTHEQVIEALDAAREEYDPQ